jgi:hypothetical protein
MLVLSAFARRQGAAKTPIFLFLQTQYRNFRDTQNLIDKGCIEMYFK